jgi:ParB family transcriptional regulator, chromosome partitioning protein
MGKAKALDLTSRVRSGMALERQSADQRLAANDVAGTAVREVSELVGLQSEVVELHSDYGRRFPAKISDLVSNPHNPRIFYNPQSIDGLAKSFEEQGQIEAIQVTRLPEFPGKLVIVDGERRKRAAKARGDEFVDAEMVPPLEAKKLFLRAYHANKERDPQTVFDDAIAWKKLLDERVYLDYNELAAAVGESPTQVNKVILLTTLPENFLNRLAQHSNEVGLGHAYNLKLIYERADVSVAEHWLQEVIEGKVSVRRLEQVALAQGPAKKTGSSRTHYQSKIPFRLSNGVDLGELKLFRDGRTVLALQGVPAHAQQVLADRMKVLIDEWSREISTDSSPASSADA